MLEPFDWLRLSETGAELLATLLHLSEGPEFPSPQEPGPPPSALQGPCQRCWVYPPPPWDPNARYCSTCQELLRRSRRLGQSTHRALVIWGNVQPLPWPLRTGSGFRDSSILGSYVHDENRFLLMLNRRELKPCLQELVLHHGPDLKGFLQIFPTVGRHQLSMGELLCRIVYHEGRFPRDRLRVRFFSATHQIFKPHVYESEGILTFEVSEFLDMLEMAAVFRTLLRPDDQHLLYEFLHLEDPRQIQFYWGRLMGYLNPEARDMLTAWNVRQWSKPQVELFYTLLDHVSFYLRKPDPLPDRLASQ